MKLYDYFRSTACYRVRIALNIKNIDFEKYPIHLVNHGGEQHFQSYREINPQSLVPTLDINNNQNISQSLAIIEYLEEIVPSPALLPSDPFHKAQVRSLALCIACDIHPLNNLRVTTYLKNHLKADTEAVERWYFHWLKLGFEAIEYQLKNLGSNHSVCYGETVSLADICLIPQVYNAYRFGFPMSNYPIISAINDHCLEIEAFKKSIPFE